MISTSRQPFRAAATGRSSFRAGYRLLLPLVIAILLIGLYVTGSRLPQRLAYFRSQGRLSDHKLRQFSQSVSKESQDCNAHPRSAFCKLARKQSRANRQRPRDWSPKPGWPESLVVTNSMRHTSERALTALEKAQSSSLSSSQSLQSVLQSLWLTQSNLNLPITQQSSLPQCSALYNQPCIALIGELSKHQQVAHNVFS